LLDWVGATIAGSTEDPARILSDALIPAANGATVEGAARLVPSGHPVDVRAAALINATASHTVELDDIYREGVYHPGSPTVGAALAVAEHIDASGQDLLRAIAVGYEIGGRIAETINPAHYRFWHTTGTVGTLGAAAAAGELLRLSVEQMAQALAVATTMAAGLQQSFRSDSMSKALHAGHAAEAGVLAALAAARGFTGALDVLDGPAGLGTAMSDSPSWASVGHVAAELVVQRMTVKDHACCGHAFAAVDAMLALRAEGLGVDDIEAIEIDTYTTATEVAGYGVPTSMFEAKFSIAYCVAAALVLGTVRLRAFTPDALSDPRILACAARISVRADEEMERDFPGRRRARLTVRTTDGRTLHARRDTRRGDPDDPLTDDEMTTKFVDIVEPMLGARVTADLAVALWAIGDLGRVRTLKFGQ
jgi:2-methylcitrate dehydratase PrpD